MHDKHIFREFHGNLNHNFLPQTNHFENEAVFTLAANLPMIRRQDLASFKKRSTDLR